MHYFNENDVAENSLLFESVHKLFLVYSSLESSNLIGQLEGSTAHRVQVYYTYM